MILWRYHLKVKKKNQFVTMAMDAIYAYDILLIISTSLCMAAATFTE
jgi:hypothetical protein